MATDPQVSGFDADEVRAGLTLAMNIGLPPAVENQPTFYFEPRGNDTGDDTDEAGVPFGWAGERTYGGDSPPVRVPCAIESFDRDGQPTGFGVVAPYRIALTFLDRDYAQVKGFSHLTIGGAGNRYRYLHTEPEIGLVSIGVHIVHCVTDDEG